jgi:hypothetical protein
MAGSTRRKGEEGERGHTGATQNDEGQKRCLDGAFRPGRSSVMVAQSVAHLWWTLQRQFPCLPSQLRRAIPHQRHQHQHRRRRGGLRPHGHGIAQRLRAARGGCVAANEDVCNGAGGGARPDHPQHLVHSAVLPQGLTNGLMGVISP